MQKFYHFSIDELAANGIRFYEDLYMVRNQPDVRRVFVGRSEHAKSVESQYAFVTTITSSWLPVYSVTHRVERRSDGQTVAIAKETVLGGGLIGKYMRGFGGGQDAEFISCGYTGGQVGHWRPNDTSNPRYREYQATDNAFVLRALGRREVIGPPPRGGRHAKRRRPSEPSRLPSFGKREDSAICGRAPPYAWFPQSGRYRGFLRFPDTRDFACLRLTPGNAYVLQIGKTVTVCCPTAPDNTRSRRSGLGYWPIENSNDDLELAMRIVKCSIAMTASLLIGCSESPPKNEAQYAFLSETASLKQDLQDLHITNLFGDSTAKLAPQDAEEKRRIEIERKRVRLGELMSNPPAAELWNAQIVSLKWDGPVVVITAKYGEQVYWLRVTESEAQKRAGELRADDEIQFSGKLMAEGSKTAFGQFVLPEFTVYPTKVVRRNFELTQSSQVADLTRSRHEAQIAEAKRQREQEAAEDELKTRIKEICQETIEKNLRFPESAYYPNVIKKYEKATDGHWIYFDTVSAKNELGADIPRRFKCDGRVKGDEIVVVLKYFD